MFNLYIYIFNLYIDPNSLLQFIYCVHMCFYMCFFFHVCLRAFVFLGLNTDNDKNTQILHSSQFAYDHVNELHYVFLKWIFYFFKYSLILQFNNRKIINTISEFLRFLGWLTFALTWYNIKIYKKEVHVIFIKNINTYIYKFYICLYKYKQKCQHRKIQNTFLEEKNVPWYSVGFCRFYLNLNLRCFSVLRCTYEVLWISLKYL